LKPRFKRSQIRSDSFLHNEINYHRLLTTLNLNNEGNFLRSFISTLKSDQRVLLVPLMSFLNPDSTSNSGKIIIGLRADCCGSLSAALYNASIYKELGVSVSFYFNHKSNYFYVKKTGVKYRVDKNVISFKMMSKISSLGHEIGLHNDLLQYTKEGYSIRKILTLSLRYLKKITKDIRGTTAHNSAWSYGRENFMVFDEYKLSEDETTIDRLSMKKYKLEYEGNFPITKRDFRFDFMSMEFSQDQIRDPNFQKSFFLQHPLFYRDYDFEIWLLGQDLWVISDYRNNFLASNVSTEKVSAFISGLVENVRGILLIHPEYVSADVSYDVTEEMLSKL